MTPDTDPGQARPVDGRHGLPIPGATPGYKPIAALEAMSAEADVALEALSRLTPGKGVRHLPTQATEIHLARSRYPAMRTATRVPTEEAFDGEAFPAERRRCVRTLADADLEVMADVTREVRPRDEAREERPAPGRRERFVAAVSNALATALGVAR